MARRRRGRRDRRPRGRRRARVRRPPRPLPRARQRGRRDDRVRSRGGRPRRVHDRLPDAEHDAGARRPGGPRPGPGGGARVRARRSARWPGARSRPGGRARPSPRSASSPTRVWSGSPTTARACRRPSLVRSALAYAGALGLPIVDHAEDATQTAGAEANDGFVATVLGLRGWPAAAEETAVARDLAILAEVVRDVPGARLHLTHLSTAGALDLVRRAKAAGLPVTCDVTPHHLALTDEWLAGARRWAWEATRRPVGRRDGRDRGRAVRVVAPRQSAVAVRRRTRPRAGRRCSTGPPTRSPRTTRRTRASTRTSSSGWRRTGSAESRRRSGSCWRRSTPGCSRWPGRIGAADDRVPPGCSARAGARVRRPASSRARRPISSCSIGRRRGPWSRMRSRRAARTRRSPAASSRAASCSPLPAAASPTRRPRTESGRRIAAAIIRPAQRRRVALPASARLARDGVDGCPPRLRPEPRLRAAAVLARHDAGRPVVSRAAAAGHRRRRRHRRRLHGDQRGAGPGARRRGGHAPRGRARSASAARPATAGSSIPATSGARRS